MNNYIKSWICLIIKKFNIKMFFKIITTLKIFKDVNQYNLLNKKWVCNFDFQLWIKICKNKINYLYFLFKKNQLLTNSNKNKKKYLGDE